MESINLLTYNELADKLKMSGSTLRIWVMHDKIPYIKIGRMVRFEVDSIVEWMEQNEIKRKSLKLQASERQKATKREYQEQWKHSKIQIDGIKFNAKTAPDKIKSKLLKLIKLRDIKKVLNNNKKILEESCNG